MRTIVIVGAVVLTGATIIGFMMNERNKDTQPSFSNQGIPQMPSDAARSNTVDASGNPMLNPAHGQPGHRCDLAVGAPLTSNPAANASAAATASIPVNTTSTQAAPAGVALNPAHGQPGHRCDISVGAPLNSAPKGNATTQTSNAPVNASAPKVTSNQVVAPSGLKTNPAHGQPGHRCDLAVGAPLTASATTDSIK